MNKKSKRPHHSVHVLLKINLFKRFFFLTTEFTSGKNIALKERYFEGEANSYC